MENQVAVFPEVSLTAKGLRWQRTGHPWVYRDDVQARDPAPSGQIVRVKGPDGRPLGQAFYHAGSKIALRWLTDDSDRPIDRSFWAERLSAAVEYRKRVVTNSTAFRLVHSEADGLPGLIVDRYGPVLVLQVQSLGMDRILTQIAELLKEMIQPEAIVARNDAQVRTLEGLPLEKKMIHGSPPGRVEIQEGQRRYLVDVWEGQKTGAYLDQRENRLWAGGYAKGRVLDVFAYQGGFSIQVADRAEQVLAIEDSEAAVQKFKENLELNQITNVQVERDNAFDRLRRLERDGERFDLVILDPPAFAKARQEVLDAARGYREINIRALRILKPGGILISCSCSYQMSEEAFVSMLRQASRDSKRAVRWLESRTQARDHPILLTHPESKYLKCIILEAA